MRSFPDITRSVRGLHKGGNIMVWRCMTASGVGRIYKVEGTMKPGQYHGILANCTLPSMDDLFGHRDRVFMHDNDPKHTARAMKAWLQAQPCQVLDWPAQRSDLNLIENLWEILNQHPTRITKPGQKKEAELWVKYQAPWARVSADTCRKLIESMPKRMDAVIKNKGYLPKISVS